MQIFMTLTSCETILKPQTIKGFERTNFFFNPDLINDGHQLIIGVIINHLKQQHKAVVLTPEQVQKFLQHR